MSTAPVHSTVYCLESPDPFSYQLVAIVTGIDGIRTSCQSSQSNSTISGIGQLTTRFCSVQIMSIQLVRKPTCILGIKNAFVICTHLYIQKKGRQRVFG